MIEFKDGFFCKSYVKIKLLFEKDLALVNLLFSNVSIHIQVCLYCNKQYPQCVLVKHSNNEISKFIFLYMKSLLTLPLTYP